MVNFNVKGSVSQVVSAIKSKAGTLDIGAIIFMASTKYDFSELSSSIQAEFANSQNIGCTTSGEVDSNALSEGSVSVTVFPKNIGKMSTVMVEDIGDVPIVHYKKVEESIKAAGINLTNPRGICFSLSTGLNAGEEKFLSVIDSLFPNKKLPLIGGSAGDDVQFKDTFVSLNGEINNNATVCLFINSDSFKIYKENIFFPSGKRMQITKASVQERTVYEIDGKKASKRYSEMLGIDEGKLADYFGTNPLGQLQGEEIFIRSPHTVNPDGSITFYSQLYPGAIVDILEIVSDIEEEFNNTVGKIKRDFRKVEALFGVNCILRTLQFKNESLGSRFCKTFNEVGSSFCGFSSYGEQLGTDEGYTHLNQTLVVAVYGQKK